ncbi:MAG TPA: aminotransferase class III-fold pyridoxal phosphate-dependent enzyme, partial [Frankiaceae bacterium]|nr:aminotransferase class III-fold pyridoxal phosphate-dependent enzyme [Frankiaceae bacterium]
AVIGLLATGEYQARARELGGRLHQRLSALPSSLVRQVRGRGLWAGVELAPGRPPARAVCELLLGRGVLAKDTHDTTIRIAPPLVVDGGDLDWAVEQLAAALRAPAPGAGGPPRAGQARGSRSRAREFMQ